MTRRRFVAYRLNQGVRTQPSPSTLIALLMTAGMLWYASQRVQVGVDRDGWTVRIGRYLLDLRWAEISTVVIEDLEPRDEVTG